MWREDELDRVWHDADVHPDDVMVGRIGASKALWDIILEIPYPTHSGGETRIYALEEWDSNYGERSRWRPNPRACWAFLNDLRHFEYRQATTKRP